MLKAEFLSGLELPLVREVTCDGCGACCQHMGYPPFTGMYDWIGQRGDPEWLALPAELADEVRRGAMAGRGDAELPCIWLDQETKRCRHYDQRPQICRDFEMGSPECLEHRSRRGL